MNAVWRDNALWVATTVKSVAAAESGQTTAYWIKLNTSGSSVTGVADLGAIGGEDIATGAHTFFSSIGVNENGDVAIGFSASASSIYAGAYFVTRESGDAAGTTSASQTVKAGEDYYVRTFGGSRNRWGDYSAAVVDPANGCLWSYNEWAAQRSTAPSDNGRWGTAYAKTCTCTPTSKAVTQNEWTMFSLACSLGQEGQYNTIADLFPELDTAEYGDPDPVSGDPLGTWVVFERDANGDANVEKAHDDPLVEGKGYWFMTSLPNVSIVNEGMKLSGAEIPLEPTSGDGDDTNGRWNLVGHPHNADIPWADVKIWDGTSELTLAEADPDIGGTLACDYTPTVDSSCIVSRKLNQWNGAAYQVYDDTSGANLIPLDAMWVEAFKEGATLRIPATPLPLGSDSQPAALSAQTNSSDTEQNNVDLSNIGRSPIKSYKESLDWSVRLITSSGHMEDPGNLLGQRSESSDGKDIRDLEEPDPFASPYLSIVFPHEDWNGHEWGYTTDFHGPSRKPEGEWAFTVKSSDEVSEVTLHWEGPKSVLQKARLIDERTGEEIRLGKDDSYTFTVTGAEHPFRFVVK